MRGVPSSSKIGTTLVIRPIMGFPKVVATLNESAILLRSFGYNSASQLTSESIGGIYNKMINRTYSDSGFKGRYTGMDTDDKYHVAQENLLKRYKI